MIRACSVPSALVYDSRVLLRDSTQHQPSVDVRELRSTHSTSEGFHEFLGESEVPRCPSSNKLLEFLRVVYQNTTCLKKEGRLLLAALRGLRSPTHLLIANSD